MCEISFHFDSGCLLTPMVLFPEKKLALIGYFSHWVWCFRDNNLLLIEITMEGTSLIKWFLSCLEATTCFLRWDRSIIGKAISYVRHIYHVTATEHITLTLKILALTIRIGLLLPRTVQGNITCIFYPSSPAKAEKGPAGSIMATKIWGNCLRKRE